MTVRAAFSGTLAGVVQPRQMFSISAFTIGLGLLAAVAWLTTGDVRWVRYYFLYPAALFLIFTCLLELKMTWISWSAFQEGEPMEFGWFLLMMAAFSRALGATLNQAVVPFLPPDFWLDRAALNEMGIILYSPLTLALIGCGLFVVLRIYSRLGLLARPRGFDWLWIGLSLSFLAHQVHEVMTWLPVVREKSTVFSVIKMSSEPLLSALLIEAIVLYRSARHMGGGLISRCWATYAAGVLITSLGDAGIWAEAWGYLQYPYTAVNWYIWLPAAAAFGIAPTYQVAALSRAWALQK